MAFLVDTNVFLRIARRTDPDRQLCLNAIRRLKTSGEDLCYTTQTLMEF